MALTAPSTLAEVRDEVFTRCTLNTGGDRGARALKLVDACIRRAQTELVNRAWLRLAKSITIPLVTDVYTYDFPDEMDPGRYMEMYVRDATSLKLLPLSADPSQSQRNALANSSGRPQSFWFDDEQLYITPKPLATSYDQLVIRGYLRPNTLVSDTDLVVLDAEAVIQRAEIHLRPRIGMPVTQDMKDTHLAYLRDVKGNQTENAGTILGGDTSQKCVPQQGPGLPISAFQYDAGWIPPGYWGE
jgi:hypothetical protein